MHNDLAEALVRFLERYRHLIRDWVCALEREPPTSLALQLPLLAMKQLGFASRHCRNVRVRVRSAALDVVRSGSVRQRFHNVVAIRIYRRPPPFT
jgi:hypothetical protein